MIHLGLHFENGKRNTQSKSKWLPIFFKDWLLSLWLINGAKISNSVVSDHKSGPDSKLLIH